jgi:hypothetical protein
MPIYKNRDKDRALNYWNRFKRDFEYKSSEEMMREHDNKMLELIQNNTIEETTFDDLLWINPTNLVKKKNGKYCLVIDTRKVNKFMEKLNLKLRAFRP